MTINGVAGQVVSFITTNTTQPTAGSNTVCGWTDARTIGGVSNPMGADLNFASFKGTNIGNSTFGAVANGVTLPSESYQFTGLEWLLAGITPASFSIAVLGSNGANTYPTDDYQLGLCYNTKDGASTWTDPTRPSFCVQNEGQFIDINNHVLATAGTIATTGTGTGTVASQPVSSTAGFPQPSGGTSPTFWARLTNNTTGEVVAAHVVSSGIISLDARGLNGTTAVNHPVGDNIYPVYSSTEYYFTMNGYKGQSQLRPFFMATRDDPVDNNRTASFTIMAKPNLGSTGGGPEVDIVPNGLYLFGNMIPEPSSTEWKNVGSLNTGDAGFSFVGPILGKGWSVKDENGLQWGSIPLNGSNGQVLNWTAGVPTWGSNTGASSYTQRYQLPFAHGTTTMQTVTLTAQTFSSGSTTATLTSCTGILAGMLVTDSTTGASVPTNDYVISCSGTTLTLAIAFAGSSTATDTLVFNGANGQFDWEAVSAGADIVPVTKRSATGKAGRTSARFDANCASNACYLERRVLLPTDIGPTNAAIDININFSWADTTSTDVMLLNLNAKCVATVSGQNEDTATNFTAIPIAVQESAAAGTNVLKQWNVTATNIDTALPTCSADSLLLLAISRDTQSSATLQAACHASGTWGATGQWPMACCSGSGTGTCTQNTGQVLDLSSAELLVRHTNP